MLKASSLEKLALSLSNGGDRREIYWIPAFAGMGRGVKLTYFRCFVPIDFIISYHTRGFMIF